MNTEQYIEQKATTIYSGGMNAVKVVAEKDALSAIGLARREMIDKACDYLRSHIDKDLTIYHNNTWLKRDEFIERLRKAIEE